MALDIGAMRSVGVHADATLVDQAVDVANLYAVFQPIVDLETGDKMAYEALARWRDGELRPDTAFPAAAREARLAELDWACRAAAVRGALDAGLGGGPALFINVETASIGLGVPSQFADLLAHAAGELSIVVEITERALLRDPSGVLRIAAFAREHGWGVALDDVGAEPASLTLLPFIAPDVIKLDISLIQDRIGVEQGQVMAAVMAHAEATGAAILAEGIETDDHLDQALALGATLGQGWLFGRPGSLTDATPPQRRIALRSPPDPPSTPFSMVRESPRLRIGRKRTLLGLSRHIESQGMKEPGLVVLSTFQTADRFTPGTHRRYERLGHRCGLVGAIGADMPPEPATGVRGAALSVNDPLRDEWTVISVGSHYAGALIARDLHDDGPDDDRRFEFVVTHDRDLVLRSARSLMSRIVPLS
ncbi:MAG: hypothetical protein NVS3B12_03380 [Acidimicrobiales bacterium]